MGGMIALTMGISFYLPKLTKAVPATLMAIIAVTVIVEHGGAGSTAAAPVARATLDAWLDQEMQP